MTVENEWIPWEGGEQPVENDVLVDIKMRSGTKYEKCWSHSLRWFLRNSANDIVAYRVITESGIKPRPIPQKPAVLNAPTPLEAIKAQAVKLDVISSYESDESKSVTLQTISKVIFASLESLKPCGTVNKVE